MPTWISSKKRKRTDEDEEPAPMRDESCKAKCTTVEATSEETKTKTEEETEAPTKSETPRKEVLKRTPVPLSRFEVVRDLAESLQGNVSLAHDTNKNPTTLVALKKSSHRLMVAGLSKKGAPIQEDFAGEIKMLANLTHLAHNCEMPGAAGFAKMVAAGRDRDQVFLASEFCPHGELFDLIGRHNDYDVRGTFRQICETLQFLHRHGIAHRDMSLENVMLNSPVQGSAYPVQTKIIDFGVAIKAPEGDRNRLVVDGHFVGKLAYAPPQVHARQPYNPFAADVWCLGVMLVRMLFGSDLYSPTCVHYLRQGKEGVRTLFRHRLRIPSSDPRLTEELVDLVTHLLDYNEDRRLSIEEVLQHPWFSL